MEESRRWVENDDTLSVLMFLGFLANMCREMSENVILVCLLRENLRANIYHNLQLPPKHILFSFPFTQSPLSPQSEFLRTEVRPHHSPASVTSQLPIAFCIKYKLLQWPSGLGMTMPWPHLSSHPPLSLLAPPLLWVVFQLHWPFLLSGLSTLVL